MKENKEKNKVISTGDDYFIVMGDIINSSKYDYDQLKLFRLIIDQVNIEFELISPLTITLGDEFQGIANSLEQAINILFKIEEKLIRNEHPFEFRYSIGYGEIITPINSEIAHGMYGTGLTRTRDLLEKSKKDKRRRFDVLLPNEKFNEVINDMFFVYQSFLDNWNEKDYKIISEFYDEKDYKVIADKLGKGKDQIWKREKNLRIREFFEMQEVILKLTGIYSILLSSTKNEATIKNEFYTKLANIVWHTIQEKDNKQASKITKSNLKKKFATENLFNTIFEIFSNTLIH